MEALQKSLDAFNSVLWGPFILLPMLALTGLYLTIRLGGIQFVRLWAALHLGLIRRKDDGSEGDISQFQALTTALAATVGMSNIVGVATALSIGGPGALFWMWVTGILGMATKYCEAFLGVRYRTVDEKGERNGGPQYYLEHGIKGKLGKVLGLSFSVFTVFACFGIGNMTQSNAIAANIQNATGIPLWATGLFFAIITGLVLVGGVKSIGRVTSGLVPLMLVLYIGAGLWIIAANIANVPAAFAMVLGDAFTGTAAAGGFAGSTLVLAMQLGFARGLFSNESGMGSSAIAAAAAQTSHPVRQGLVSMTQTFIDTIIVISITGFVILTTGAWQVKTDASIAVLTANVFREHLPGDWGHWVVTISLVFFAFSTILGWFYYGERALVRLVGRRGVLPFRLIWSAVVYVGATTTLEMAWVFSDITNGLMAIPNLIGLVILSGLVVRETRAYLKFDPKLEATDAQIREALKDDAGFREWLAQEEQQLQAIKKVQNH